MKEEFILKAKDQVAKEMGFEEGVMGTSWEYAMLLTHRRKIQILMYEKVIDLMAGAIERLS